MIAFIRNHLWACLSGLTLLLTLTWNEGRKPTAETCAPWCKWDDNNCIAAFKKDQCQGCERCKELQTDVAPGNNGCDKGCAHFCDNVNSNVNVTTVASARSSEGSPPPAHLDHLESQLEALRLQYEALQLERDALVHNLDACQQQARQDVVQSHRSPLLPPAPLVPSPASPPIPDGKAALAAAGDGNALSKDPCCGLPPCPGVFGFFSLELGVGLVIGLGIGIGALMGMGTATKLPFGASRRGCNRDGPSAAHTCRFSQGERLGSNLSKKSATGGSDCMPLVAWDEEG
jgi:hypothetical protein